jgi:hypothetical protein
MDSNQIREPFISAEEIFAMASECLQAWEEYLRGEIQEAVNQIKDNLEKVDLGRFSMAVQTVCRLRPKYAAPEQYVVLHAGLGSELFFLLITGLRTGFPQEKIFALNRYMVQTFMGKELNPEAMGDNCLGSLQSYRSYAGSDFARRLNELDEFLKE